MKLTEYRNSARRFAKSHPYLLGAVAVSGALAISALLNLKRAKQAEADNPPKGQFIDARGVRLHFIERGRGEPLVLFHGNGSMFQDFETSGLIEGAATRYRVIVFDRPGFGHSERPRGVVWSPKAQAELFKAALDQLGISRTTVLGHSWGASVAVAMALEFPDLVKGLVLASGYYYPTWRADVIGLSIPAIPLVGDVIRYAISPTATRLIWPLLMRKIFSPHPVPRKFQGFPEEMAVRPSQIRASAGEAALMIPNALKYRVRYSDLRLPVSIIAGEEDRLINIDEQSARLHSEIPDSRFIRVRHNGHMIHQTATVAVLSAINDLADEQSV